MKKFLALFFALTMTTALLGGCGSKSTEAPDSQAETTKTEETTKTAETTKQPAAEGDLAFYEGNTIIGQSSWIGFAPMYLAEQKGFFKNHGADVSIQLFESKTDSKSALMAKRIQGMSTTIDTHVLNKASGMDISVVLALDTSAGGDGLIAKSDLKDVKSLAGHTVALDTTGGASYFWFQYLLQKEGMTLDDVQAVNMSSGDAGAAFIAGEVDAAVTWEPWLSKAKETEGDSVMIDSSATPGIILDALAMDNDFIKSYPGTVRAIVSGWYDALDYIKSNPEDAYKIMAEYTGNDSGDSLKAAMESEIELYDEAKNLSYFETDIYTIADMASELWIDMGLINEVPDSKKMITGDYLERLK
ncbi:ABC transporter substrate-binding protein [Lacrimispora sp. JR3]|uniref:ABC transporter substrate-binding protein n=1 Tax=Lacrimispora sinapis TaxID=3111456 RepID=UPI003749A650